MFWAWSEKQMSYICKTKYQVPMYDVAVTNNCYLALANLAQIDIGQIRADICISKHPPVKISTCGFSQPPPLSTRLRVDALTPLN